MIKISRIYRRVLPIEQNRIAQVQDIFRNNFSAVADYAEKIPDLLDQPFKYGYTTILLVSESSLGNVTGFSLFMIFPNIRSALLDFIAVKSGTQGSGTGGALYEATRDYLKKSDCLGLYYEVLPDDPAVVKDKAELKENQRRLRFYEGYGARPIINTDYETPVGDSPAPHLVYDSLDRPGVLKRSACRAAMRTILTHKYSHLVSPDYIENVVESVIDEPVKIREPKYIKTAPISTVSTCMFNAFSVVFSDKHTIHHVHDRGYVERPVRVPAISNVLSAGRLFEVVSPKHFSMNHATAVHDKDFVNYLKAVCEKLNSKTPVYPYVFPIRRSDRRPKDMAVRAGYYCIDTFTPLDHNAYTAAREAINVAMTAADLVLEGRPLAYALCRPPGHHAERRTFGGFCYFNNAAIAANYLSGFGKVATLDIDFHHGNGTQDIFYRRNDVLTVSIHGNPNIAYPYFSGFADETGEAEGVGYNLNLPLDENAGEEVYLRTLDEAIARIMRFAPVFLVVSLGFDIMKGDPTGSFSLSSETMKKIGNKLALLNKHTLVVQEGGYNIRNLKTGSAAFFNGFARGLQEIDSSMIRKGNKK